MNSKLARTNGSNSQGLSNLFGDVFDNMFAPFTSDFFISSLPQSQQYTTNEGRNWITVTSTGGAMPRQTLKDNVWTLAWDMPGVKIDDVTVDVVDSKLSIKAKRSDTNAEITCTYPIDENVVDLDTIQASLSDGVLSVELKHTAAKQSKRISVQVKQSV